MQSSTYSIIQTYIENRNYSQFHFINTETNLSVDITDFHPKTLRLFHGDVFSTEIKGHKTPSIKIIQSPVKSAPYIAGVLLLENNKTYGRTTLKKRLLYKCIPDDIHLPAFLVPYEMKLGFSKKIVNKYVLFRFSEWSDTHPLGMLTETIGDVSDHAAFCEYRLCCRHLRPKSHTAMKTQIESQMQEKRTYIENIIQKYKIQDRTSDYVIAIDPEGSRDYDDAFSCKQIETGYCVSIHIANVFLWLESLQLWNMVSTVTNVSSMYLPDKRRPMLPPLLSENLCSLTADGDKRIALTIDISVDTNGAILTTNVSNTAIYISKNYVYESKECQEDATYKMLYKIARMQSTNIHDSHDVVAHWMMKMNSLVGQLLAENKTGIFRKATPNETANKDKVLQIPLGIPSETRRILETWASVSAEYVSCPDTMSTEHCVMNLQNYVHITSPIRRLVDIINQIALNFILEDRNKFSEGALEFLKMNMENIRHINENTRTIRKTQQECDTLYKLTENPDISERNIHGIIVDIDEHLNKITAYLEELNMMITVHVEVPTELYSYHMFRVYVFEDEYKIRQKLKWVQVM